MVAALHVEPRFTEKEYLALEAVAEVRHEYIGGDIIGTAGAELERNQIKHNVEVEADLALRDRPCHVLGSDQRVRADATREYFYPDAVITCLDPQLVGPAPRSLLNPQVIVEVLSPGTEAHDRGAKWIAYQTIPTLTDYLMIASDRRRVEHYQRDASGCWMMRVMTEGSFTLSSGTRLEIAALYRQTKL